MKSFIRRLIALSSAGTVLCLAQAYGQVVGNWPIAHSDGGHSGWQKIETKISKDTVTGQFKFLWKMKLGSGKKDPASFSEPLLAPRLINAQGFKDIVLWGSTDTVYAVDYELARMVWQKHFDPPASGGACGASNLAILVEPPHVINFNARRTPGAPALPELPPTPAGSRRLGESGAGGGFGIRGVYVLTADGYLHEQVLSTGADFGPPVKFLPSPAGISNGLNIEGKVLYTATEQGCGKTSNALWAIDLANGEYPVFSYPTEAVKPLASMGPTLADGVAYLATGAGEASSPREGYPNSIVALTDRELKVKDWYTPAGDEGKPQNVTPVAFTFEQKKLLAAAGEGGRFVLLDPESLGGPDHHTPLFQTSVIFKPKSEAWGGMTNWQGPDRTSWVLASVQGALDANVKFGTSNGPAPNGSIVAFKVEDQDGKTVLTPAWSSHDLVNPSPPVVTNGVVIALSQGNAKTHAKLYVLDAATGKELYSSGAEVATYAKMSGVSVGDAHVFFTTHDGTLYSFGIDIEH
jgi:outer membrane protein assembly factor BamB